MNKWSMLAGILMAVVFIIVPQFQSLAQDGDCGNGLIQRLEVGDRGWIDPAPPAQGVRMRQAPGEAEVARLQPGEEFTVLDGPQCFNTYSWFEVETDTGKRGWIAEGVEAGEYFIDPLALTNIEIDTASCSGDPAPFEIGQYVNLTRNPTVTDLYYGHPLVDGAYFSLDTYFLNEYAFDSPDYYISNIGNQTADYLITRGAICVNSIYMWQIQTNVAWFWLDEAFLALSKNQPSIEPVFTPQTINLTEPPPVLIAPELQIAWDGSGGGGGGGSLLIVDDGCQSDVQHLIHTYEYDCVAVYPFQADEEVDIKIKQADGTLIYETAKRTESIELFIQTSNSRTVQTQGVQVVVPTKFGVTSGVYIIEASTSSSKYEVAYLFQEDYSRDYGNADADVQ